MEAAASEDLLEQKVHELDARLRQMKEERDQVSFNFTNFFFFFLGGGGGKNEVHVNLLVLLVFYFTRFIFQLFTYRWLQTTTIYKNSLT